jgi:hypothetical protein
MYMRRRGLLSLDPDRPPRPRVTWRLLSPTLAQIAQTAFALGSV